MNCLPVESALVGTALEMEIFEHQVNVTRMIRTEQYALKHMNLKIRKDALRDESLTYRSDIITTSLYCDCDDCYKFCCYGKPIKCIDPYLMDMRYTRWIYHGLVTASKTASTRIDTTTTKRAISINCEEPKQKRHKH